MIRLRLNSTVCFLSFYLIKFLTLRFSQNGFDILLQKFFHMKLKFPYFLNSSETYCKHLLTFEDFHGSMPTAAYLGGVKGAGERNREATNSSMHSSVTWSNNSWADNQRLAKRTVPLYPLNCCCMLWEVKMIICVWSCPLNSDDDFGEGFRNPQSPLLLAVPLRNNCVQFPHMSSSGTRTL